MSDQGLNLSVETLLAMGFTFVEDESVVQRACKYGLLRVSNHLMLDRVWLGQTNHGLSGETTRGAFFRLPDGIDWEDVQQQVRNADEIQSQKTAAGFSDEFTGEIHNVHRGVLERVSKLGSVAASYPDDKLKADKIRESIRAGISRLRDRK